ncbi:unnamed protein product [Cylindrotheca closterium]|uniref:Uncharacterized protein n=1 Tax=Cylindrotheca closterium TaxID=2856 RepID=A0AAD2G3Z0_9STRA|nr:unnamed protein product [Cylindrotheca closterium]
MTMQEQDGRVGDRATTTDSNLHFADDASQSSLVSAITLEDAILPSNRNPLHSLQEQRRLSDLSPEDVERLMDSFGQQLNVTRFSDCSEGRLCKPCSMPQRKTSMGHWKSNQDCDEVLLSCQPCAMPQRKPSLNHRQSCLYHQDVQPCLIPLQKPSMGHDWESTLDHPAAHQQPCSMPQRKPSMNHRTNSLDYSEELHDSNRSTFLKTEMPFGSIDSYDDAETTGKKTVPILATKTGEPRRKYGARRKEKDRAGLGFRHKIESDTSLELVDVFVGRRGPRSSRANRQNYAWDLRAAHQIE